MIIFENVSKTYKTPNLKAGFFGNLKNLFSREYREIQALKNISFNIEQGEIVGLIGANGAGKSTTIKLLTGVICPDAGQIMVDNRIPQKHNKNLLKNIGVVFGQRSQLWWDIGVEDSFDILKDIYDIDKKIYQERLAWLTEVMDIKSLLGQPVRTLSLGQKMKCDLVASLLHNPKILFLDEPTIGLDVTAKLTIREFLKELNREFNTTILLTSHDLFEIEKICEHVLVIDKGELYFKGTLSDLKNRFDNRRIVKFKLNELVNDKVTDIFENMVLNYEVVNSVSIHTKVTNPIETVNILLNRIQEVASVNDIIIEEPSIEGIIHYINRREVM